MKKKLAIIVAVIALSAIFLSSCRTNKPGIVPCPTYKIQIENIGLK